MDNEEKKSNVLSRDDILGTRRNLQLASLYIPNWGGEVYIRELTSVERDEVESWLSYSDNVSQEDRRESLHNLRGRMAAKVVCDERGVRLFSDNDAEQLGQLSSLSLDMIFEKALQLAGMSKAERDKLRKNLSAQEVSAGSTTV